MKGSRYEISLEARTDLLEILTQISLESESAAVRMEAKLFEGFTLLADFPNAGRDRPDLHGNLRYWTVAPYLILYRTQDEVVQIVAILHGARDVDSALEEREL